MRVHIHMDSSEVERQSKLKPHNHAATWERTRNGARPADYLPEPITMDLIFTGHGRAEAPRH